MSKHIKNNKIRQYKPLKRQKNPGDIPFWLRSIVIVEFIVIILLNINTIDARTFLQTIIVCILTYIGIAIFWKTRYRIRLSGATMPQIDKMTGEQFEDFLALCYRKHGFDVKTTPKTCDFGADLLLTDRKTGQKICIQAKRYRNLVGEEAVQQTLSGREYYGCDKAMIITNSHFTEAAKALAKKCNIKMIDRSSLGKEQMYLF